MVLEEEVREAVLWLLSVVGVRQARLVASLCLLAMRRGDFSTGQRGGGLSSSVVIPLSASSDSATLTEGNDGRLSCLVADCGVDGAEIAVVINGSLLTVGVERALGPRDWKPESELPMLPSDEWFSQSA